MASWTETRRAASILALTVGLGRAAFANDPLLERAMRSTSPDEQISLCSRILEESKAAGDHFRSGQAFTVRAHAFKAKRRYEEALADADSAIAAFPGVAEPFLTRAQVRHADCAGAMADIETAVKLSDAGNRSVVYYTRAQMQVDCGARDKAVADYRAAIGAGTKDSGPIPVNARLELGTMYCDLGRFKEGIKWLSEAETLAPKRAEPWLRRGICLVDSGQAKKAGPDLDKGIARLKLDKSALSETSDAYFVEDMRKIVAVGALRRRAELSAVSGNADGAMDDLQTAAGYVEEPPDDRPGNERREVARVYALRARLLAAKGEKEFAKEDRQAACRWDAARCPKARRKR